MAETPGRDGMGRPGPSAAETTPVIDLGRALELLAQAVEQPVGRLLHRVLSLADAGDGDLDGLGHAGVYQLYVQDRLPVRLTLGGLVVLDAAQRAQDRGYAVRDALDQATDVAARFVDLIPDAAFPPILPVPASLP